MYLKIADYGIHRNQLTEPNSLCASAKMVLSISIAIAYNFFALVGAQNCAFF